MSVIGCHSVLVAMLSLHLEAILSAIFSFVPEDSAEVSDEKELRNCSLR